MNPYTDLARASLEHYLKHQTLLAVPDDLPDEFYKQKRGTFVSWHDKDMGLRGCIGTFMPTTQNIAEEIIDNAVQSGVHDPRFFPIGHDELNNLTCKVDVLSDLEYIQNMERDLNPRKYGVYITTPDGRSGILLPDLEGVDTIYQQVGIACQKGDIDPQNDDISVRRFTVDRYSETAV